MRKVGRTRFQLVHLKGKQCAMTGELFSEKRARVYFSAPFAQWRSPNASLYSIFVITIKYYLCFCVF